MIEEEDMTAAEFAEYQAECLAEYEAAVARGEIPSDEEVEAYYKAESERIAAEREAAYWANYSEEQEAAYWANYGEEQEAAYWANYGEEQEVPEHF